MDPKTVSEQIYSEVMKECKALVQQFTTETDSQKRMEIKRQLAHIFSGTYLNAELEPFGKLNALVARRFKADHNWVISAAALAIHQNLIKQKLAELGVNEKTVEQTSRRKGLNSLVKVLEETIRKKENRKVSLKFYRSSALRTIRNRLEHEGYRFAVSREEMLSLLDDLLRFESELYPTANPQPSVAQVQATN